MSSDRQKRKLSDIALVNPKEIIPKGEIAKKVPMEKLRPFSRDVNEFVLEKFSGGAKFKNGDTIMARITPCLENGKTAKINFLDNDEVGFGSTEYIVFRAIEGQCDEDYLYYLITSPIVREAAIKSMVGSSGRQRVQTDVIQNLKILVPSFGDQQTIGRILRSIDDKITVNDKINQNLEEQANALFKSWFIDFDPFGGTAPETWKSGKLRDILMLRRNSIKAGSNTDLPYLPIDVIPMNTLAVKEFRPNDEAKSSLISFKKDDIIIGAMRVYFHRVIIAPCDGITRTTCFTLTPYDPDYLSFALLCCNQKSTIEYAQTTSKGSTMPYAIWDGGLGDMDILIPSKEDAYSFSRIVHPLIKQIQSSYYSNKALAEIRDTLLPKLMSGELDVSALDI